MAVTAGTRAILDRGLDGAPLSWDEALHLVRLDLDSDDGYALLAAAHRLSRERSGGRGTVYSQVGINSWPCPENCDFCSLGAVHGLVTTLHELTPEEVVTRALAFERGGADEVYLMTTANYPVGRFLEIAQDVRRALRPATALVANIGDIGPAEARALADAGCFGIYHVYRFGEGVATQIVPERRRRTFAAIREAGLDLRYCVEPVGPEHTDAEIVQQMFYAREFGATICAVMRRIPIAGTPHEQGGRLTESRIAQLVAATRLVLSVQLREMGVHEPSLLALRAGAHRICAEEGMNPRDLAVDTAAGRGRSVADCEQLLWEAGYTHPRR
jgi:biotin synthase